MPPTKKELKWRFDVNTFRLIGRELITDRITAVFELVKNCYDANATEVTIQFLKTESISAESKLIISDNGTGMSLADIRDKWMVVGTGGKRSTKYSSPPFNRRFVGEKGIGRFAVDKLGSHLEMTTKQQGSSTQLGVIIDWNKYIELSGSKSLRLFTDVGNSYSSERAPISEHGTTLLIRSINEAWSEADIIRLERELEKITSPFHPLNPSLQIRIQSDEYLRFKDKEVKADPIRFATVEKNLNFDLKNKTQETLTFDQKSKEIVIKEIPIRSFGPVSLDIFYFNESAKIQYTQAFKQLGSKIDGIKIYRDGIIATPFAEYESDPNKQRDILGIDKRLWSGFLDKVGSREVIGVLAISKERNPQIIDATNRQDFVWNREYRDLKDFVIQQLIALGELKKTSRDQVRKKTNTALAEAEETVKSFADELKKLERMQPKLKSILSPLKAQAKEIKRSISDGLRQQSKEKADHLRKENIYLSLMSLQEYAIHVSHAVRTSLSKVKRMAEFFKDNFPNPKYEKFFKDYAVLIFEEMSNLNRVIDFMLSYAGSNLDIEEVHIKPLLEDLLGHSYRALFEAENINISIEIKDEFVVRTNRKFFEDIFQNLVSNSVKALRNTKDKSIKVEGWIDKKKFFLRFADNGTGVPHGDEEKIFDVYYTTTADQGGAGLGLYIVKTRVESLNGTVRLIQNTKSKGATFEMVFSFATNEQ